LLAAKPLLFKAVVKTTHTCTVCKEEKALAEFPMRKTHRPGKPVSQCTKCRVAYNKAYRAKNKEKVGDIERRSKLKMAYGITPEQYDTLLAQQNGKCAICLAKTPGGRTKMFFIDHCHTTGNVRGLLCMRCNTGLGLFLDNPKFLSKAISYLKEYSSE
jgi:CRISPR/Cas system-associated protein Cas10 (large subunit of type III CRISPR-Cas system)